MSQSVVAANEYSGEHRVRACIAEALAEFDYHIARYQLSDRNEERHLTVVAVRTLGAQQTHLNFNLDRGSHPDQV